MELTEKIRLYNMDCMELLKDTPDKYYDLAIVDPPYGIGADKNQDKVALKKGHNKTSGKYKKYHLTNWDSSIPDKKYFDELFRVSKNQIIWGANYFKELSITGVIVWDKGKSIYDNDGELALTSLGCFRIFRMNRADAYINNGDAKIHPTQKPKELYKWLLSKYAQQGDKILDTHAGSFSIGIACDDMGFDLTATELDTEYFEAAVNRFKVYKSQLKMF